MDSPRSGIPPLAGRRIVVTRAAAQAAAFIEALEALGAEAIPSATIRIESLAHTPEMRAAVRAATGMAWCVLASANAVEAFQAACALEGLDAAAFKHVRFAAVGPPTAERLRQAGFSCDLVPERYVAEGLLEAFDALGGVAGERMVLPRAEVTRPVLPDGLRARGALLEEVVAYRTVSEDTMPETLIAMLEQDRIDLVTFTSGSTATHFAAALPEALASKVRGASIGPVTSAAMRATGIHVAVEAAESTIAGLTAAIVAYCAACDGVR